MIDDDYQPQSLRVDHDPSLRDVMRQLELFMALGDTWERLVMALERRVTQIEESLAEMEQRHG